MSSTVAPANAKKSILWRISNVLLSFVLVLGLLPSTAFAEVGENLGADTSSDITVIDASNAVTSLEPEQDSGMLEAADDTTETGENEEGVSSAEATTYKQSDGYEAYTGWQGWPWPGGNDSSTGGTTRKGWPAISFSNPLSLGTIDYQGGATVTGSEVTVVTDMNATDTSIVEPTANNPWYYKNIILPTYDVTQSSISFVINGVAPGGMSNNMASKIALATSDDPTTWDGSDSTIIWQATSSDVNVATAGSNWWKRVTITAPTDSLEANQTYYLMFRSGMPMGNTTSYANIVFEFSTSTGAASTWEGDQTAVGYLGCQGTGTNKVGFFNPAYTDLTVDITKASYAYYNRATKPIELATAQSDDSATSTTQATFRVHADGSGSNWTNLAGWQDLNGNAAPNINIYASDPTASGAFDVSGLTPVCTAAAGTLTFASVNGLDMPTRDGVDVIASGLDYDTIYYLVFNANFAPNNMGALGTPVVLEFTTAEDTSGYTDYTAQGGTVTARLSGITPDEDGSILASIKNDANKNSDTAYVNRIVDAIQAEDGVSFTYTLNGGGFRWATVDSAAAGKVHVYSDAALTQEVFAATAETAELVSDGTFKVSVPAGTLMGSKDYYLVLDSTIETNSGRTIGKNIVFKFTTAAASSAEGVDKSLLLESINNANAVLSSATVGTDDGQYPQNAVDELNAAIATAQVAYDGNTLTSLGQVKLAATTLDKAVAAFKATRIFSIASVAITGGVPETIVAGEGDTAVATVVSNPQDEMYEGVVWSASSNVSIDPNTGVWTALTWGDASITATSASDPSVSATVEFTITEPVASYMLTYTYDTENKTATLAGFSCDNTVAISVVVPETVEYEGETYTVTALASGLGQYKSAVFGNQPTLVRSLTLPQSMKTIGAYAFRYMTNLKEVDLGGTQTIATAAFSGSGIEEINIPDTVTSLEQSVFSSVPNLKKVTGMKGLTTIPSYTFNNTALETIDIPENVTALDYYAITANAQLKSITGMANVDSMGIGALSSNVALETAALGEKLITLPQTCFSGDTALKSVVIPASVTTIEGYAFYKCTGLREVLFDTHEANVPSVAASAFAMCNDVAIGGYVGATAVANLVAANSATEANSNTGANFRFVNRTYEFTYAVDEQSGTATVTGVACKEASLTSCNIEVPEKALINGKEYVVTALGSQAFASSPDAARITSVTLPATIESVGEKAFANMGALASLTSLSVSETLPVFAANSFEGTTGVAISCYDVAATVVALAQNNAGTQAGANGGKEFTRASLTKSLSDLTITAEDQSATGEALDTVVITDGDYTLVEGTDYTIEYQNNVEVGTASFTTTGIGRYNGTASGTFGIYPYILYYQYNDDNTATVTSWSYHGADQVDVVVPATVEHNGQTYTVTSIAGASAQAPAFNDPMNRVNTISVPNTLTTIGNYAFTGCSKMVSFTIPASVTTIGDYAFYQCFGLKSIHIPSTVTSAGAYAFANCTGLESVTGMEGLTALPSYGFYGDAALASIHIPANITSGYASFYSCSNLAEVTGMEGLTEISGYMFAGTAALKSFTVPEGVTSIGQQAFYCASGLESITIPASVTSVGSYAFYMCSSLKDMTFFTTSATAPTFGYSAAGNTSNVVVYGFDSAEAVKSFVQQNSGSATSYSSGSNYTFEQLVAAKVAAPSQPVYVDQEFSVDIVLYADEAACAEATLDYDASQLTLVGITAGSGLNLDEGGSFMGESDGGNLFSFYGNTASAAQGLVVARATFRANDVVENASIGLKDVVVSAAVTPGTEMNVTKVDAANITVNPVAFEAKEFAPASEFVKVVFTGVAPAGKVVLLNGEEMSYDGTAFVAVVSEGEAAGLTSANFTLADGARVAYQPNGDINGNGKVNIVDAQVVYDVATGKYKGTDSLSSAGLLNGDVSGDDGILDSVDAFAIQYAVHYGANN